MTENKRYNVKREKRIDDYEPNNHIINEKGETVISLWNFEDCKDVCALLNEQDERIQELETENKQLIKEWFESEKDYIIESYHDNAIRRDEKIQFLKEEFKERFGDVE